MDLLLFLRVAQGATLTIGSHAHLDLSGPGNVTISNISVGGAFVNDGTITAEAGSSEIDLDSFTNAGTLIVNRTLLVNGAASNTGTVNVTSGTFHVTGALTGAGTTNLATGATVELGSTATGGTIHFGSGQSTLKIDTHGAQEGGAGELVVQHAPRNRHDPAQLQHRWRRGLRQQQ
jgi:hypothetical protein